MTTPTGKITVFGLSMPVEYYQRIVAAVRGLYPAQSEGKSDAAAAQAALKEIITDLVARWETANATRPVGELIAEVVDQATESQRAANGKARNDGATMLSPTVTA